MFGSNILYKVMLHNSGSPTIAYFYTKMFFIDKLHEMP